MAELYPVRSITIAGAPAVAIVTVRAIRPEDEIRSVSSAEDIDRERQNPAEANHCPLCNEVFGPVAFAAHAQDCINTRAPRWERQRDVEPTYHGPSFNGGAKRFRPRIFGPNGR